MEHDLGHVDCVDRDLLSYLLLLHVQVMNFDFLLGRFRKTKTIFLDFPTFKVFFGRFLKILISWNFLKFLV